MERPFLAYKGEAPYIFVSYAHAACRILLYFVTPQSVASAY